MLLEGCATLRRGRKDKDVPVLLIRGGALLKTLNLPKMAASFDFVRSTLHQIRASLIQSYLERMMCLYKCSHTSLSQALQTRTQDHLHRTKSNLVLSRHKDILSALKLSA